MEFIFENYRYNVDNPSSCPHCHNGIEPVMVTYATDKGPGNTNINYSVWRCTHRDCRSLFVAVYKLLSAGRATFQGFLDGTPLGPHWPESILKLESKFITTYMQALQAEYAALDEIAGMGFRKSIEYLVKDYVMHRNNELKGTIEDKLLAKVIAENFNEPQESDLKELLLRATWLGNDMTHYLKYHENFDINDLKELIKLVVDEIHSIEQKRHYIATIQSKYKKQSV